MKDYKNTGAPESTITFDKVKIEAPTQNIYEAISIMSKRASQVNEDLKSELIDKLEEFATFNDSLEEVFENKEQIEVSRFYERLPKPTSIAVQEWLDGEIYYRNPDTDNDTIE
ncbi:DNA-directed RNA polymerase subunit omega [Lutimonas sp.]|jgi:DNA-directed RNA polymerase subunit K/omega|uniref:DNA-directed RNA polymerase subunit omega n=1 Tax=Lutimonas sp. TaxID=1872403 RepID=UPI003C75DCCB